MPLRDGHCKRLAPEQPIQACPAQGKGSYSSSLNPLSMTGMQCRRSEQRQQSKQTIVAKDRLESGVLPGRLLQAGQGVVQATDLLRRLKQQIGGPGGNFLPIPGRSVFSSCKKVLG